MGLSLGTALLLRSSGRTGRLAWVAVHGLSMVAVRTAGEGWGVVGLAAFGLQILRLPPDTPIPTLLARTFWPTRIAGGPLLPARIPIRSPRSASGTGLVALGLFEILVVAGGFATWTSDAFDGHGPIGMVSVLAALVGFCVRVVFELAGLWHLTLGTLAWAGRHLDEAPAPFLPGVPEGPLEAVRRVAPGFAALLAALSSPPRSRLVAAGLFFGVLAIDPLWMGAAAVLLLAAALHPWVGRVLGAPLLVAAGGLAALLAGSPTPRRAAWMFDGACGRFGIEADASGLLAVGMGVMVLTFGPRTPAPGSWLDHPVTAGVLAGTALVCVPWAHLPLVFQL